MERKVAIIGAGTSGLLACKYLLDKGFTPIVFEALNDIGGVWLETMETTTLQTPRELYQFSDHPWPDSVTTTQFPNKQQVMDYLQSYVARFGLAHHIRFNTKVVNLRYEGSSEAEIEGWSYWGGTGEPFSSKGRWFLTMQDTVGLSIQEEQFEFVILSVGKYSGVPNIPKFPFGKGPESFKGKVIHSMDCAKMEAGFMKARTPVIVGFGKTGLDIAMACSAVNGVENPCTLLYRTAHWTVPADLPILEGFWSPSRFSELLVHKPEQSFKYKLIATMLSPLMWAISKYVETVLTKAVNLRKYDMMPKHSFVQASRTCTGSCLPEGFYERVERGSIKLAKSETFSFNEDGILIESKGESIKTELVILCTGFRGADKVRDMFTSPSFRKWITSPEPEDDELPQLYREMIHPRIPQLVVLGFPESVSHVQITELMSRWVAELLDGNVKLPSIKDMEKNIAEWDEHMKPTPSYRRRLCVGAFNIWFNDLLCKDMGRKPYRKKNIFSEIFDPYGPLDYAHL